jgi:DNA-binding XRE family transcriptional regulator/DNA polymerase III delta prime subunit
MERCTLPDIAAASPVVSSLGSGLPGAETEDRPFAEVLRSSRFRAGLTQRALADLSTISARAIRDIEAGRVNARMQTILLLADGLRLHGVVRELFIQAGLGTRPAGIGVEPALSVPTPVTAILGRDTEVRTMMDVLESGRRRMISLSGLPGVGKTRLAMEIAARLGSRGWPVLWIGAASHAFNGRGTGFGPLIRSLRLLIESGAEDVSQICKLVGQQEALLVLDGVADVKAPLGVEELLAYCPGVRVISTSRAPWYVTGVQAAVIPPLPMPGPEWAAEASTDMLASVPSVRMLVDRLSEVRLGFAFTPSDTAAAAQLCWRLDGLPLALEAVAGLFRVFALRELAEVPEPELLELAVPARWERAPETLGTLIGSRLECLSAEQRVILWELAQVGPERTIVELAESMRRPLHETVDDLSVLIGNGLVLEPHGEPATQLRIPNLLRALVLGSYR